MKKKILDCGFFALGAYVGLIIFNLIYDYTDFESRLGVEITSGQLLGMNIFVAMTVGYIFFQLTQSVVEMMSKTANKMVAEMKTVSAPKLLLGLLGLIIGFIISFLLSSIYMRINIFNNFVSTGLTVITYIILGYLGVMLISDRTNEILGQISLEKKFLTLMGRKEKNGAPPKIIDTSVIIDGRLDSVIKSGFLEGKIIIPEFVLLELQHIADSSDSMKRKRGRRGLDVLKKIQETYGIEIYNSDDKVLDEIPEVDMKLLKLAQLIKGKVVTNDFNLNKVAKLKKIEVLNINELASGLKPVVLPEECLDVELVKEGKERKQALAYLDDGTMIVVEEGKDYIGQKARVKVSTVLQNPAGKMIFAKFDGFTEDGEEDAEE